MSGTIGNIYATEAGKKKKREGDRMQQKAQGLIDSFQYDELVNPFETLEVSQLGSDFQKEQINRGVATEMDALDSQGQRAVLAGVGGVSARRSQAERGIGANLDQQQMAINSQEASFSGKIQDMQERRQAEELSGYGQMLNVGMAMKYQGMADMVNAARSQSEHIMKLWGTFSPYGKGSQGQNASMMSGGSEEIPYNQGGNNTSSNPYYQY